MALCGTDITGCVVAYEVLNVTLYLLFVALFHDLLWVPMFHHSVWSVITAHNLTTAKRDVTTVVSDQRSRFNRVSTIDNYNTPDIVVKHRRPK